MTQDYAPKQTLYKSAFHRERKIYGNLSRARFDEKSGWYWDFLGEGGVILRQVPEADLDRFCL